MGQSNAVSFLTLDGKIACGAYTTDPNGPDRKKLIMLTKIGSGEQVMVHQRRIIPLPDDYNTPRAVGLSNGCGKIKLVCPIQDCRCEMAIKNKLAVCPNHGSYEIVLHGVKSMPDVTQPELTSNDTPPEVSAKAPVKAPKKDNTKPAIVNVAGLAEYGELWAKDVGFDHPSVGVRAYVLLADNPPRKLCVNTYDGSLGKKSKDPIAELGLVEFRDHTVNAAGLHIGHSLVKGLDTARKALAKLRYSKM